MAERKAERQFEHRKSGLVFPVVKWRFRSVAISTYYWNLVTLLMTAGSLTNDEGNGDEKGKKATGLY